MLTYTENVMQFNQHDLRSHIFIDWKVSTVSAINYFVCRQMQWEHHSNFDDDDDDGTTKQKQQQAISKQSGQSLSSFALVESIHISQNTLSALVLLDVCVFYVGSSSM